MSADAGAFSFNFAGLPAPESKEPLPSASDAAPAAAAPAEEVTPDPQAYQSCVELETVQVTPELSLFKGRVASHSAAELLRCSGGGDLAASDLVPGQYEGGFKLWEGSLDLARFLAARWALSSGAPHSHASACAPALPSSGKGGVPRRVLELGCGQALPGLVALLAGAEVHFQDYNRAVIEAVTARNVAANLQACQGPSAPPRARYFAGGWAALPALLQGLGLGGAYDAVLSAETLYCQASHAALYQCILHSLKHGTGVAYVAAKSYYFGVGGGTASFRRLVEAGGVLTVRTAAVLDDGTSVKREILELALA